MSTQAKAAQLAKQIIPTHALDGFLALDLRSQLTGIATLAHIGGDTEAREAALEALKAL